MLLQISADFVTGFEKYFFSSESSSDNDVNNFCEAQVVSETYHAKNTSFFWFFCSGFQIEKEASFSTHLRNMSRNRRFLKDSFCVFESF